VGGVRRSRPLRSRSPIETLAVAYMHQASGADLEKAIAELERAVSLRTQNTPCISPNSTNSTNRPASRSKAPGTVTTDASVVARRDDALNRAIALQTAIGQVDEAIRTMASHTFAVAEGANLNVVDHWAEAHILRAQTEIQARTFSGSAGRS